MKSTNPQSIFMVGLLCFLAGVFGGCATPSKYPTYVSVSERIQPVQEGYARVFFYTATPLSQDIFFKFSCDGERIGEARGFQAMFIDHHAGSIKVTVNSGGVWPAFTPKDLLLNLVAGETRYIQAEVDPNSSPFSPHLRLIIKDPDQAMQELNNCFYVGPSLPVIRKE
jgi:hypothetical protein